MPLSSRRVLLRTETQIKGRWVAGLDTTAVKEIEVTRETFAPPAGWREVKAPKLRAPASIPARPLRWVGPISSAPDVFALYWNGPFSASFISSTNSLLASMVTTAERVLGADGAVRRRRRALHRVEHDCVPDADHGRDLELLHRRGDADPVLLHHRRAEDLVALRP